MTTKNPRSSVRNRHVRRDACIAMFLMACLLLGAVLSGAPLMIFFDFLVLLAWVGITAAALVIVYDSSVFSCILEGTKRLYMPGAYTAWNHAQCRKVVQIANTAGIVSTYVGGAGALIGLIQMMMNLDDPSAIGPSLAFSLLSLLYSAVANLLLFVPLSVHFGEVALEQSPSG